jgi:AraC-like DNA-binding protein
MSLQDEFKCKQEYKDRLYSPSAFKAFRKSNAEASQNIPQHALCNPGGKPVSFDVSILGKTNQNYDFERPHRHDFYEIIFFNEGGGVHDIDFETYPILSKSVHFIASDNVHLILREKKSTGYSLLFTTEYFNQNLMHQLPFSKSNPVLKLDEKEFALLNGLIDHIREEQLDKHTGFEGIIKSYMEAIVLNLLRVYNRQHPGKDEYIVKPKLIHNFIQLVQQNCLANYKVEDYSKKLNISSKHLIELSKTHIGKTPLAYIRGHVISEAKRLLFYTELSIKEIAYKLNFDDPANFSKYFKTATGYTPVEYREGVR